VPLRDACVAARAAVEDPAHRRKRQHADRVFRSWTDRDGMWAGSFRYAPEIGAQMKAVIEKRTQQTFREHKAGTDDESNDAYAADAVAEFILSEAGEKSSATNVTVHVVVGNETLKSGELVPGEVCEIPGVGPVDVNWVREKLGSAFITAIIKKGKGILTVATGSKRAGGFSDLPIPKLVNENCDRLRRARRERASKIRWRAGRRSWSRGTPRSRRRRARGLDRSLCSHRTGSRDRTTGRR
jgi:hypothetical protein